MRTIRRKIPVCFIVPGIFFLISCGDDLSITVPDAMDSAYGSGEAWESGTVSGDNGGPREDSRTEPGENDSGVTMPETVDMSDWGQESASSAIEQAGQIAEEEAETPEAPSEITVTISAVGDVTLGNYLGQEYSCSFRQTYEKAQDEGYFFENVEDIFSADDMTIVNLEGPLTMAAEGRPNQIYTISGDPSYAGILTAGGVEAVSMGNNHRLDYLEQGSQDTVAALEGEGLVYAYDDKLGIYETKGIRIGYVSVNEVGQGAGVEKYIQEGFAKLQEEGADLILACCHWGVEREYYPEDYQKSLGKKCIDWGADLVIGHHPHVIQGIEEYQGKFIVYSLGNFCFGANRNPPDKDCFIFQQTFTFRDGVKQEDAEGKVIPCSLSSVTNINDYKPTPASGSEAERIIDRLNEYSLDFGVQFDKSGAYIIE